MVDSNRRVIQALKQHQQTLNCDNLTIIQKHAIQFCQQYPHLSSWQNFDLVFLDPPFHQNYLNQCCQLLTQQQMLHQGSLIYLETEQSPQNLVLPEHWQILKQNQAGQVYYYLTRYQ